MTAPVLVGGEWRAAAAVGTFEVRAPVGGEVLGSFPVSAWVDVGEALDAGVAAFDAIADLGPAPLAAFLEGFAAELEAGADELVAIAHAETALPVAPRLRDVELPRTTDQLRQAAAAVRSGTWRDPVLSPASGIAAMNAPLPGPVVVFGPNNFPFAFNGVGGGDFAAAVATGHPVVAKANPGHPATTSLLAEIARGAAVHVGLPAATVQLLHHLAPDDGCRLVADQRVAATAYTGSRRAGVGLKAAADAAGRPLFAELSSVNPVVVLPGALAERGADDLAAELAGSVLLGGGQFCTSPGLVLAIEPEGGDMLSDALGAALAEATGSTLLGPGVATGLEQAVGGWLDAGAKVVAVGHPGPGCSAGPTVATVGGATFLAAGPALQTEAFGSAVLVVLAADPDQLVACVASLEGQLTGSIYSASSTPTTSSASAAALGGDSGMPAASAPPVASSPVVEPGGTGVSAVPGRPDAVGASADRMVPAPHAPGDGAGADDELYRRVEGSLRRKVGRLLNDKVPTGVAVVPAMHHGGPWPATTAPQFTAVGMPAALLRFTQRQCWDNVRDDRLPPELQAANPLGIHRTVADHA